MHKHQTNKLTDQTFVLKYKYAYRPAGDSALEGHEAHKLELAAADATVA